MRAIPAERHDYKSANPPPAYAWPEWAVFGIGVALVGVALVGLAMRGDGGFTSHHGDSVAGFEVNPLHDLVHLATGIAALATWRTLRSAFAFGVGLAVLYVPAFVYGLFAAGESWDPLALNAADNVLHAAFAVAGVAIALGAVRVDRRPGPPSW